MNTQKESERIMANDAGYSIGNDSHIARLLVIDDDIIQRTVISKIGMQAGFMVEAASSFEEASRRLNTERFDCVTLDLSLGDKSGALLLRTIADGSNRVPVVVISGADEYVLNSTIAIAQSLGLDSKLFAKPLNLVELRNALIGKRQGAVARRGLNQLRRSEMASA